MEHDSRRPEESGRRCRCGRFRESCPTVFLYCVGLCTVERMVDAPAQLSRLEQDLRKGVLVLAALSQLRKPQYGYSLRQALARRGMAIEEGTLYPLLRRLESQGVLVSKWQTEDGPPRRYYELSSLGMGLYEDLTSAWGSLASVMDRLLNEKDSE